MRCKVAGLGMGLIGAAMLLAGCGQDQKLQETQQQLTTATNDLAVARAETSDVKTQMQAKVDELQQNISKLTEEKADADKQMQSLKADLEQKVQLEQTKVETLEQDKTNMTSELKVLSDQLDQVNQRLADLQKTHATTVAHLQAMREEYVTLTNQKAALEAKLNDLVALKAQITVVKQEIHAKKVEELKRLDRAEFAMGNHGYLLKEGSWMTVTQTPGSYPLSQELYRDQ
jgi:chromosome segregation ATPase